MTSSYKVGTADALVDEKVPGIDQDECAVCNMVDAAEMINDYENALAAGTLPFVPE